MQAPTVLRLWKLGWSAGQLAIRAQLVIGLRFAGMAGDGKPNTAELHGMVFAKQQAFAQARFEAAAAFWRGRCFERIMTASLKPLQTKASGNVKRLTRPSRGPRS